MERALLVMELRHLLKGIAETYIVTIHGNLGRKGNGHYQTIFAHCFFVLLGISSYGVSLVFPDCLSFFLILYIQFSKIVFSKFVKGYSRGKGKNEKRQI